MAIKSLLFHIAFVFVIMQKASSVEGVDDVLARHVPYVRAPAKAPVHAPVPTHTPKKAPVHAPVLTPKKAPVHAPSKAPVHAPVLTPKKAPAHAPSKAPVHAPVLTPKKAPAHAPSKAPIHAPTISPVHSPRKSPAYPPVPPTKGCEAMCRTHCKPKRPRRACMKTCTICCAKTKCVPGLTKSKCHKWDKVTIRGKMIKCP